VYYLFLRLQQKPMLSNMVTNDLPESIFFDSNNNNTSKWVALKSDQSSTELSEAKVKAVNSKNVDDTINR
jgi:hypothetical protein